MAKKIQKRHGKDPYPVIDLFAGPGGLGEGFASLLAKRQAAFETLLSFERDDFAHRTLLLRHFFRAFPIGKAPVEYYDYLTGSIALEQLQKKYPGQWKKACQSALKISLGAEQHAQVKRMISSTLGNKKKWVLVGGPPCQAYSLVGRSRRANDPDFERDEKHFLYKEYLKIIIDHRPPVFVMENVKGLLSAKVTGEPVIEKILKDLSHPKRAVGRSDNGLSYRLYSLSQKSGMGSIKDPTSYIVKAEEYGIPQARHRIFIVGVRSDFDISPAILQKKKSITVRDVIGNLPKIRSGISGPSDSSEKWKSIVSKALRTDSAKSVRTRKSVIQLPEHKASHAYIKPKVMQRWYCDKSLKSLSLHESRSHMESDLRRYCFSAAFAKEKKASPKLSDFPKSLLPKHKNVKEGRDGKMFSDRFRVQLPDKPSTTITSHISKDGHYYIHYDPLQCRSLTVREAARLQTFPDNYYFEGPRTEQYHQVGNAVPPLLAQQIAKVIKDVLDQIDGR